MYKDCHEITITYSYNDGPEENIVLQKLNLAPDRQLKV